jgi:serine/threonine protein kinase
MELGQGGTADVYLAMTSGPTNFNKLVVLKTLRKGLQADPEFRRMFFNEARLAARLNHPNIVQTYEVIEDTGAPTIVMEYLEGRPLSSILRRGGGGQLPLPMLLHIVADALVGLQYAHDLLDFDGQPLHVIHRDATPQNIFVTFDGQVKVLDFGIAKLGAWAAETRQGTIKGKIRYIAPEQMMSGDIDARVDVYAMGVVLWHIAAGEPLWKDEQEGVIASRVVRGDIPSPRELNPGVLPSLELVCMKALSPSRDNRYPSASALAAAVEEVLAELGSPITSRELGREVSRLFGDVRAYTKSLIDHQLTSALNEQTGKTHSRADSHYPPIAALSSSVPPAASPPSDEPAPLASSPPGRNKKPILRALPWIGVAILLALLVQYPRRFGDGKGDVGAPPSHPLAMADAQSGPAAAGTGTANAGPATDHAAMPEIVPGDPERPVDLDALGGDQRVPPESYAKAGPVTNRSKKLRGAHAAAAPPPAPPDNGRGSAAAKPECETPFYINEHGIKKLLPECI